MCPNDWILAALRAVTKETEKLKVMRIAAATANYRDDMVDFHIARSLVASGASPSLLFVKLRNIVFRKTSAILSFASASAGHVNTAALPIEFWMRRFPAADSLVCLLPILRRPLFDLCTMACRVFGSAFSRPLSFKTGADFQPSSARRCETRNAFSGFGQLRPNVSIRAWLRGDVSALASGDGGTTLRTHCGHFLSQFANNSIVAVAT